MKEIVGYDSFLKDSGFSTIEALMLLPFMGFERVLQNYRKLPYEIQGLLKETARGASSALLLHEASQAQHNPLTRILFGTVGSYLGLKVLNNTLKAAYEETITTYLD